MPSRPDEPSAAGRRSRGPATETVRRRPHRLFGLLFVLAIVFGLCSAAQPHPAAVEPHVLTELDVPPAQFSREQLAKLLDRLKSDRIDVVSAGAHWSALRPAAPPSAYQWGPLDNLVQLAGERGLLVRLRVAQTPAWLHPDLTGVPPDDAAWYPPQGAAELAAWSTFLTDLTERYGSRILALEIWNEPNEPLFWKPSPDPVAYAAVLRASYLAVKKVAPQLTVTSGGLSRNDLGYLSAYYDAAQQYPDSSANHWFYDQLGLHPYCGDRSPDLVDPKWRYSGPFGTVDGNFATMDQMVQIVATREGAPKRVWISEFGYSTRPSPPWTAGVPDTRRAYFLARAYARARDAGFVDGMGWYHSMPTPWDLPGYDILDPPKGTQTYVELTRVTGGRPTPAAISSGLDPTATSAQQVTASHVGMPSPPTRMELYVDGRLAVEGTSALTWDPRTEANGPHQAQLVAWTGDGSTYMSPVQTVTVQH
jgi:hypothetical protein